MKYFNKRTALALCFLALLLACNAEKPKKDNGIKVYKVNKAQQTPRTPKERSKEDSLYWENEKRLEIESHNPADDFIFW